MAKELEKQCRASISEPIGIRLCLKAVAQLGWSVKSRYGASFVVRHPAMRGGPPGQFSFVVTSAGEFTFVTTRATSGSATAAAEFLEKWSELVAGEPTSEAAGGEDGFDRGSNEGFNRPMLAPSREAESFDSATPETVETGLEVGWHQDPENPLYERFWDGAGWSTHTRRIEESTGGPAPYRGPLAPASDLALKASTRTWFIARSARDSNSGRDVLLGVLAVTMVVAFVLMGKIAERSREPEAIGATTVTVQQASDPSNYGVIDQSESSYQYTTPERLPNGCPTYAPYPQSASRQHCGTRPNPNYP